MSVMAILQQPEFTQQMGWESHLLKVFGEEAILTG
jgi:hypothetical protein